MGQGYGYCMHTWHPTYMYWPQHGVWTSPDQPRCGRGRAVGHIREATTLRVSYRWTSSTASKLRQPEIVVTTTGIVVW